MNLDEYISSLPFTPDRFQLEAFEALERSESVVVSAPTGSGKTLIAEAAVHRAVENGQRAFYTTPIKALSNQKFAELVGQGERHAEGDPVVLPGEVVVALPNLSDRVMNPTAVYSPSTELADAEALRDLNLRSRITTNPSGSR